MPLVFDVELLQILDGTEKAKEITSLKFNNLFFTIGIFHAIYSAITYSSIIEATNIAKKIILIPLYVTL